MASALRTARMLTRYSAWADEVNFEAVAALPEGEATKPRQSIFKNMLNTLNHITYHRGFVADFFCQVPTRPPTTDLTVFLRDVPQDF